MNHLYVLNITDNNGKHAFVYVRENRITVNFDIFKKQDGFSCSFNNTIEMSENFLPSDLYVSLHSIYPTIQTIEPVRGFDVIIPDELQSYNIEVIANRYFGDTLSRLWSASFSPIEVIDVPITTRDQSVSFRPSADWRFNENYTRDYRYSGFRGYHDSHSRQFNRPLDNCPYRIGVELEMVGNSQEDKDQLCDAERNWFFTERDGSLPTYGVEMITIPLAPQHATSIEWWKNTTDWLKRHFKSKSEPKTGLHVHIGKEILGEGATFNKNLAKLMYFYYNFCFNERDVEMTLLKKLTVAIYGRERTYCERYPADEMALLKLIGYGSTVINTEAQENYFINTIFHAFTQNRTQDINCSEIDNRKTIEFRKGKGIISATRIAAIVAYCEALCLYTRNKAFSELTAEGFIDFIKANKTITSLPEVRSLLGIEFEAEEEL